MRRDKVDRMVTQIKIVWGKSEGKTRKSAFDKALMQAGIHNLNLIPLSSVIPVGALVNVVGTYESSHKVGDICYVVLSSFSSNKPNAQISAGLGWVHTEKGGLLLESKGEFSRTDCTEEINIGLEDMLSARGWNGVIETKVVTHKVKTTASVVVAAVYEFHGDRLNRKGQLPRRATKKS